MTNRIATADRVRSLAETALECALVVGASTLLVAALDAFAPIAGLGVVYLPGVLFEAVRRGQAAALGSAVASVLAFNFFFIEPRYHLAVNESDHIVVLVVLLITAVVVGRIATAARTRGAEAEERARIASARERETAMLAAAASSLLEGSDLESQLRSIERSADPEGPFRVRVALGAAPSPDGDETAVPLPTTGRPAWLYVSGEANWTHEDLERVAGALARLVDVAFERERLGTQAAETEATRRADVAKTALLHAISHDLRSPLTAIRTASGGLGDEGLSPADRSELLSVLETETARLSKLVDDLLDLSRIEAEAVNPAPDWCDLRDVVASSARQVRAIHGEHPIEFRFPSEFPLVRADAAQLERVFANLLENAVKFSPSGEPVTVSANAVAGRLVVRVTDRGPGIPRSQRARIFEPFVRGDDSRRGSGLGLAICSGFVKANEGRIALQTGPGRETSFVVSFPLAEQPAPV